MLRKMALRRQTLMSLLTHCSLIFLYLMLTSSSAAAQTATGCRFPDFMQTNNNFRDWSAKIKEQYTEFTLRVNITDGLFTSYSTDASATSSARSCIQALGSQKYVVTYDEGSTSLHVGSNGNAPRASRRFACVQFLRRSPNVVQLRYSAPAEQRDRAACNDVNLALDEWLLVDRNHVLDDQTLCSLQGGFSIRIYDKSQHRGVCDAYKGETRLESECSKGEGIYFLFRHPTCVPQELLMYNTQRTICLANWVEGPHSFMLIRHDRLPHVWVFRYPTVHGNDGFTAYLLFDLVADAASAVTQTTRFLRLDAVRDSPMLVTSLCVDDYEMCSIYSSPCTSGPRLQLTCPRSCNLCNASRPTVCSFDRGFIGEWRFAADAASTAASPILVVNSTHLVTQRQVQEAYHCIQWHQQPALVHKNSHSYLVVKDNMNGCRPRYACARFIKSGGDALSVMFAQISQTKTWPLTDKPEDVVDCSIFDNSFDADTTLHPNALRTASYNLLLSDKVVNLRPIDCGWPPDVPQNVSMRSADGKSCTASIRQRTSELVLLAGVACGSPQQQVRRRFTCVDSGRLLPSTVSVIVTKSGGGGESSPSNAQSASTTLAYCWIFPKRTASAQAVFYLVDAADCNEAIKQRVRKNFRPLATFTSFSTAQSTAKSPTLFDDDITLTRDEDNNAKGDLRRSKLGVDFEQSTNALTKTDSENGTRHDNEFATSERSLYSLVVAAIMMFIIELAAVLPCFS